MTKIGFVLGTRPEIIKLYSCIKYCVENKIDFFVVNTDQHYDQNMRDVFFKELGLPTPNYMLGVGSGTHAKMLASMLVPLEEVMIKEGPDVIVVQGDTNTVLAGALVAVKLRIKVAHIEAGLRSYDKSMPEEYNRILTDHASDFLFAPTEMQERTLLQEGIDAKDVYVTGNTVVDAVLLVAREAKSSRVGKHILLTCHRPSNTDSQENLRAILEAVQYICDEQDMKCIFPVHPRLGSKRKYIQSFSRIEVVEPLGYKELLGCIKGAEMVLTDSGGIQEEACILQKKCIILRENTERPETLEVGGATLLDNLSAEEIILKYKQLKNKEVSWYNPFGDGRAAEKIIKVLVEKT